MFATSVDSSFHQQFLCNMKFCLIAFYPLLLGFPGVALLLGFPGGSVVKNLPTNAGDASFIPGLGRSPLEKEMTTHPIFLPGKSHGQRRQEGHSSWDFKRVRHNLATEQQQQNFFKIVVNPLKPCYCFNSKVYVIF